MSLFSKNRPTNRIELDGAWVELQYLSKGVKDDIQSKQANLYNYLKDLDLEEVKKWKESEGSEQEEIPDNLPTEMLSKINEIEYYKLSKAIKSWSEKEEITVETVKDLDEDAFAKIVAEIDKMNGLSKDEVKN